MTYYYFIFPIEHVVKDMIIESIESRGFDTPTGSALTNELSIVREIIDISTPSAPVNYIILKFTNRFPNAAEGYIPYTHDEIITELGESKWEHNNID